MDISEIDRLNEKHSMVDVITPSVEIITPLNILHGMEQRIEMAGRVCYKSEAKITDESASKFIKMLIKSEHVSVIEHEIVTARFILDRTASHQLVRHRIAAYSQESQRYCNYGKRGFQFICPPSIQENPEAYLIWYKKRQRNVEEYLEYIDRGIKPEDARCCLPGCSKTEVVATYNLRVWRHLFKERALNAHAQWQIRGLMQTALRELGRQLPNIFGDQLAELLENPNKWILF